MAGGSTDLMVVGVLVAESAAFIAPADAGALVQQYGPYMRRLIAKQNVPLQELDDVLHNILARLIERNVLDMYDPGKTVTYKGREIKVTFKAFLSSIVVQYAKGQRDKLGRQDKRELLIADRPQDESGTTWAELFGGAWFDDYSHLDAQEFINRMRAYLAMVPPTETVGLLELFDELVREVRAAGEVSVAEVKQHFSITTAAAKASLGELQAVLREAPEAPPPSWEVHGVTLGAVEVHDAIAVLEAAKGIMVRQPLERAGHPLAGAERGWYHPFSKEEVKLFPEVAIDPQTHKKPAGHVKLAVLHRLHRMLAEASSSTVAPEAATASAVAPQLTEAPAAPTISPAAEPDSPRDLLTYELFQLGADSFKVDYILGLADQLAGVPA